MGLTRVTVKGQVTIPHNIRSAMNIEAGDSVVFVMEGSRIVLVPIKRGRLSDLRGSLPADKPFPGTDEVRRIVQEDVARHVLSPGDTNAS